ncbi:LLM class flavin-dependent oxidoreductase [Actinospica sp.]|jgi:alkanesulfonate monooxygenase SsuD/methylene tetrahydromethanopterin reductase-like flavin-dependent oxidoreductase (luciferase family)|uniref:LLM class flavin-dependent oxidoreductase n=1 Tax=Actinospica sp. TaxID=1872142 RepID=UPI002C45A394|nr:LLM class flavin-dependent oxidoreductase [Actinospica sp.]HWG25295.1 LLM class flavin-dependent oxidoreductase [Actinospica sp.]
MTEPMRYGVILPGGAAPQQLELALIAEEHGWDGVFLPEVTYGVDAWSLLAAMAVRTTWVKLGTLLSPLPWRRPWKLASQIATVDQLSGGRAIVTVGLGAPEVLLGTTEVTDRRERAERLDEGIDLMRTLWAGGRTYRGQYYVLAADGGSEFIDIGGPVQRPVPIWVVGAWLKPRSMRRAARCDGVVPEYYLDGREPTLEDVRELKAWLIGHGAKPDIDVIADGETPADDLVVAKSQVAARAEAGCTWWLETRWQRSADESVRLDEVRERILAGPPRP